MITTPETVTLDAHAWRVAMGYDDDAAEHFAEAIAAYKLAKAKAEEWYAAQSLAHWRRDDRIKPDQRDLHVVLHDWEAAGWRLAHVRPESLHHVLALLDEAAMVATMKAMDAERIAATEFGFVANAHRALAAILEDLARARKVEV